MSRCSILSKAWMTSARNPATDDRVDAVKPNSMRPATVSTTSRSPKALRYSRTATAIVYLCAEYPST
jgi:hypothetical protein